MDSTFLFITNHFVASSVFVLIFGAIIGSFLNVLIYRYPIMLQHEWDAQAREQLNQPHPKKLKSFNLCVPRSHCPQCRKPISWYSNIPILSFLYLRGKCANCGKPIGMRYLCVEIISAVTTLIVFLHFSISLQAIEILIFTYGLTALSFIDFQHRILPDTITLSLLWLGLFVSTQHFFIPPTQAIFGAITGYLFLWAVAKLYSSFRKKDGMGLGDCKMFAMMGAWVGVGPLLNVLLLSAILALCVSTIFIVAKKIKADALIPFGPFIAIAGWCTLLYGDFLTRWMTQWST